MKIAHESYTNVSSKKIEQFQWFNAEQFTGLHDSNQRKIFEGDIVYLYGEKFVVEYILNEFIGRGIDDIKIDHGILSHNELEESEIIGNIYEGGNGE